jgi:hypothetical protein
MVVVEASGDTEAGAPPRIELVTELASTTRSS